MKRFISATLVVSLLTTSTVALADPVATWAVPETVAAAAATPAPTVQVAPVIFPLNKGQVSPATGVLLTPDAVAAIVAQQDTAQAALQLAVKHQADVDAAQQQYAVSTLQSTCDADKKVAAAQLTSAQQQSQVLQDQLKKNTGGPGAPFWIGVGVVGGVAMTLLTAFAVSKL